MKIYLNLWSVFLCDLLEALFCRFNSTSSVEPSTERSTMLPANDHQPAHKRAQAKPQESRPAPQASPQASRLQQMNQHIHQVLDLLLSHQWNPLNLQQSNRPSLSSSLSTVPTFAPPWTPVLLPLCCLLRHQLRSPLLLDRSTHRRALSPRPSHRLFREF
jgi:hypothetical protein